MHNTSLLDLNIVKNNIIYYDKINNFFNFLINNYKYSENESLYLIDILVTNVSKFLKYNDYGKLLYDVYLNNIKLINKYYPSIKNYSYENFDKIVKKRMSYHLFETINDKNIQYYYSIFEVLHTI